MSEFVRVGDHIAIAKGKPPTHLTYDGPGALPYLNPDYLRGQGQSQLALPGPSAVLVSEVDAVLLWDGSNAGEFFAGKTGIAASTMARLQPDAGFEREYFIHVLKNAEPLLKSQTSGTGIPHVDREILENLVVFRPEAPQQRVIAQVLDTLDTAIRHTEAIIAKLKQVKQGLLHDLLTRGIDTNGELRPPQSEAPHLYKTSPLGWIPSTWTCEPLEKLTLKIVDGVHQTPTYVPMGVPFVTIKNLTESQDISFKSLSFISQRDHREFYKRADPKPGDVLVTKDGTLGVARLVRESHPEFSIFVSVAQIRPLCTRLSPQLLLAFFDSEHYRAQMGGLSGGSGLKHIHLEQFRRFDIPLPPLSEQSEICSGISSISERLSMEGRALDELGKLKSGLMDDLLTGRVRVTPLLQEHGQSSTEGTA